MGLMQDFQCIFSRGSRTFFHSTKFFPRDAKEKISVLYAFVRTADNLVDKRLQKKAEYSKMKKAFWESLNGKPSGDAVIDSFSCLVRSLGMDSRWVKAFFDSMEMDLRCKRYRSMKDLDEYLYGSCEVIGLMMAKILGLPAKSYNSSKYLGKGMQYINFIRDIHEDTRDLRRSYFPEVEMRSFGIEGLDLASAKRNPEAFRRFVRMQIDRYMEWMERGADGYKYLPRKYLVPIKTASDMYIWTAKRIYEDPFIVFREKVKPSAIRITATGIQNRLVSWTL